MAKGKFNKALDMPGLDERSTCEDRVKEIIVEQLCVPPQDVQDYVTFKELGAEDRDMLNLVIRIEEEFDKEILEEDIEKFITVQDAIDYICGGFVGDL